MAAILFDATRLFMRASRTSPTGIDRVAQAYGRWLLSRPDIDTIPVCSLGGVLTSLSPAAFRRVVEHRASESAASGDDWRRLVRALTAPAGVASGDGGLALRLTAAKTAIETRPARYLRFGLGLAADWRLRRHGAGDLYLNVSHFGLEQPRLLDRLTARRIRTVAMVHDLIPILHPEYCSPSAFGWHLRRVEALLEHAELLLANSRSTAAELTAFAKQTGRRPPPICVAPLGLEPLFHVRPSHGLGSRPYFVCVGTIEPRKNVGLLLTLWRRLAERLGDATPPLVLAGQRGWETEAIVDHLERSPPVRRFVHEINGLGDAELAMLIAGATALLSPSFMEGFSLPVAEARSMGTPVIASDIEVHRELAPEARLIDPLDGPAWLEAIEAALLEGGERRSVVTPPHAPPGWPEHFEIVEKALGLSLPPFGGSTGEAGEGG
jgi:glycosyltransferase involved in cell wall biosynthesis